MVGGNAIAGAAGLAARLVGGLLALLVVLGAADRAAAPPSALVAAEPAGAAAFLAAYARGDEAAADDLASPLYRAEWARLGLPPAERAALRPWSRDRRAGPVAAIAFSYAGGHAAGGGFGQLVYAARATVEDGPPVLSAWRVDTDPDGRVVWLDLVWLFSDGVARLAPVAPTVDARGLLLPPAVAARRPIVLAGVRSSGSAEGYYALGATGGEGEAAPIGFVAIDASGEAGPGVWTYGRWSAPADPGSRRTRPPDDLAGELLALRRAYLVTLRSVCDRRLAAGLTMGGGLVPRL